MDRFFQLLLIGSTLGFSWLAMMAVHESGHVLNLWLSGGGVQRVVRPPWGFSQTIPRDNPHPLFVAWGGALWGCALPLAAFALAKWRRWPLTFLCRFFAGFCLIVNGAYLGGGVLLPPGSDDAGEILRLGSPRWPLIAFGLAAVTAGLRLWHNLGSHFGLGPSRGPVDRRATAAVTAAFLALLAAEFLVAE
jgi:hypothetical protein